MVTRMISPSAVLGLARSTVEMAVETTVVLVSLPVRALGLLDAAESLVDRIGTVVDQAEDLIVRTERVVGEAEFAVRQVETITTAAAALVAETSAVVATADVTASIANGIVRVYEPIAVKAAPLAARFVDELSPEEIEAAIKLVDELPALTEHMVNNVLPILATLDSVGPDVNELLKVTRDVRRAIVGIPGFKFFRRRGEERLDEEG